MNWNRMLRWGLTLLIVGFAGLLLHREYQAYFVNPWTRDGLVHARVIPVMARVAGTIRAVHVRDNQEVRAGDILFELDDAPYLAAVRQAEAERVRAQALARLATDEAERARRTAVATPGAVTPEVLQQLEERAIAARATVAVTDAAVHLARLNLDYTRVTAPVDGYVTTVRLTTGGLVAAWYPVAGLIDTASFRVDGFFRETQLADTKPGDRALVTLMGYPGTPLEGKVTSIDRGIAQTNGSPDASMLPTVSPTFEWIRLAQRVPVRVELTHVPDGITLRVGTTASVLIETRGVRPAPALPGALQ